MVFRIAVAAVYGYVIVLSLWAMRVQRIAARAPHHPRDHPATKHAVERNVHAGFAAVLIGSLGVRMAQLTLDITGWLLGPLTVLAALLSARVLVVVWLMAREDMRNRFIAPLNKLKTTVLLACTAGLLVDQVWRVVTLFWF